MSHLVLHSCSNCRCIFADGIVINMIVGGEVVTLKSLEESSNIFIAEMPINVSSAIGLFCTWQIASRSFVRCVYPYGYIADFRDIVKVFESFRLPRACGLLWLQLVDEVLECRLTSSCYGRERISCACAVFGFLRLTSPFSKVRSRKYLMTTEAQSVTYSQNR